MLFYSCIVCNPYYYPKPSVPVETFIYLIIKLGIIKYRKKTIGITIEFYIVISNLEGWGDQSVSNLK